jgi:hypothetical protein
MKILAIISGIGLAILWIAGLNSPMAPSWLTWLDGVGAVLSFIAAASDRNRASRVGTSAFTAVGLFVMWLIGMSTNGLQWQNWWTFIFACVMAVAAIAGSRPQVRGGYGTREGLQTVEERDRFRRSA